MDFVSQYRPLLEVFSVGLRRQILTVADVVHWADTYIMLTPDPDYLVIEIALSRSKHKNYVIDLLHAYLGKSLSSLATRAVLGVAYNQYKEGKISLENVADCIDWLTYDEHISDIEERQLRNLEGIYASIMDSWGTVNIEVYTHELCSFLEPYKVFTLTNTQEWVAIHESDFSPQNPELL